MAPGASPFIVGIGGAVRPGSSTEKAVQFALMTAESLGARTQMFGGDFLARLPLYAPEDQVRTPDEQALVAAVRLADGVIIGSPGYHGGVSGVVKNAIDLLEDTSRDERAYLDGRAVGLIVTAFGWQATGTTLTSLRSIVHALRGWPTPVGVTINTNGDVFDADGAPTDPAVINAVGLMVRQVTQFAAWQAGPA